MKRILLTSLFAMIILVSISQTIALADDGNVWLVDEKGSKHFTCPVMLNEAVVGPNTKYTDLDSTRYYYCCPGCKSKFEKDPDKYLSKLILPGNVVEVKGSDKYFSCPVTGETAKIEKDTNFSDYNGKRYYFCCEGCKPKFDADPEKNIHGYYEKHGGHGSHHSGEKHHGCCG